MNHALGRWLKAGALMLVAVLVIAACEGPAGTSGTPGKAPGVPPTLIYMIKTVNLETGASAVIDLDDYFHDPDAGEADKLTYTETAGSDTVSATVSGSMLTLRASMVVGDAKVTVVAVDAQGLSTKTSFTVSVMKAPPKNQAPMPEGKIAAKTVIMGKSVDIDASMYFKDPEGMALTYTASAGSDGDVTVVVKDSTVTITAVAVGNATVTITASDGKLSADQMVEVKVIAATVGGQPVRKGTILARTLDAGVASTVNLSMYFEHPDQGVVLSYSATSSNSNAADATVVGSMLTVTAKAVTAKTTAEITVVASDTDPVPQQTTQRFMVTVNASMPIIPPPTGGVTPGSSAITIPVDKASAELDVGDYLETGELSTNYRVYSGDTDIFTATLKAGSTSIWTLAAKSHGYAIARIESITDGSIKDSITVTVPNRKPTPKDVKIPTLALASTAVLSTESKSTNKNDDPGPMVFDAGMPNTGGDETVTPVAFSKYFGDKDGADRASLVYTIKTSREDVLVHNGDTCKIQMKCPVQLDVLKKAGGESAYLHLEVTATDNEGAVSDPVRFPVRSQNPTPQTYLTDAFGDGYRAITVGFREATHTVIIDPLEGVLKAPEDPDSKTTPKETLGAFNKGIMAKLKAYTPAAPNKGPFVHLDTLAEPVLPTTGIQDMVVVAIDWGGQIKEVSAVLGHSVDLKDTVYFRVKGPGDGTISFVYYVLDKTEATGTFKWIKSENTGVLSVTVVALK